MVLIKDVPREKLLIKIKNKIKNTCLIQKRELGPKLKEYLNKSSRSNIYEDVGIITILWCSFLLNPYYL